MLKIRKVLPYPFSRLCNNLNKLYSKTAEQTESVSKLNDDLRTRTDATNNSVSLSSNARNLDHVTTSQNLNAGESGGLKGTKVGGNVRPENKSSKKDKFKSKKPQEPGPPGGSNFLDDCDYFDMPKGNAKKWRTISYILIPLVLGFSVFILATKEKGPEPEYIPYEYMYRRTKRFAWRDGKTSLFHGPNNLIPEEEEKRLDREGKGNTARYKKHVNENGEKIKKRDEHAREEMERREKRHEEEHTTENEK